MSATKKIIFSLLMQDLQTWARDNQVPFVNAIEKLDMDRDVMVSAVHLSHEGNKKLAEAIFSEIEKINYRVWKAGVNSDRSFR